MTQDWNLALAIARLVTLALGLATTAISFRAYRETGARYLRDATVGFGIITFGVFVEGVLYQLTPIGLTQVHIVESVAISLGFLVLLRSFLR